MKKIKFKLDIVEYILIYIVILNTSLSGILPSKLNYIDEIVIILLFCYEILRMLNKGKVISKKRLGEYVIFIILTILNTILMGNDFYAYFSEIFNYLKPLIVIETFLFINMNEKKCQKFKNFYVFINIFSIIYGILKHFFFDKFGYVQDDMFRNGKYRSAGFLGHPIEFAFMCLSIIILEYYDNNKKWFNWILIILASVGIITSGTRLCQMFLILFYIYIFYNYILKKIDIKIKRTIILLCILIIFCSIVIFVDSVLGYFQEDIDVTIRMFGMKKMIEIFPDYPLLGTGIGTYSCSAAVKYDSFVYKKYDFSKFIDTIKSSSGNVLESSLAKTLIETGTVGLIFHILIFKYLYMLTKKSKDNGTFFLLVAWVVNFIFNKSYRLPYIFILAILLSYDKYKINIKK